MAALWRTLPLSLFALLALGTCAAGGRVHTGAEVLLASPSSVLPSDAGCLGVLTNPTAVLPDLSHIVDALAARNGSQGINICAVFAPEHGFRGDAQAGSGGPSVTTDARTGLSVYSLYQMNISAQAAVFSRSGVHTLVFDIQDVGARFYTYVWSLHDAMQALKLTSLRHVVVLDRPNPLGGLAMRGPVLEPAFASFIGRAAVPQQHGMTVGELARLFFNGSAGFEAEADAAPKTPTVIKTVATLLSSTPSYALHVVGMQGWQRAMRYADTGLPWVMPSPNMPTPDTAAVYPGLGILEGTNLSEGRGTTRPFELAGAAYLNYTFAAALRTTAATEPTGAGVAVRETYFLPTFSKWTGSVCAGVQTYVTDPTAVDAVAWGLEVVAAAARLAPGNFSFLDGGGDFDLHMGTNATRLALQAGTPVRDIVASWAPQLAAFGTLRKPFLLYE